MEAKVVREAEAVVPGGEEVVSVRGAACVVVGGGPAGAMLSLMLARKGVEVMLLEAHGDFDRKFRGDSLHPSVLEIVDELGLSERLRALPHSKVRTIPIETPEGPLVPADLRYLRSRYPYIMLVSQASFIETLVEEARRYPNFELVTGANVRRLVWDGGRVVGVRYRAKDGWHEARAGLVVAADGRNSKIRRLARLEAVATSPPLDVLWFSLARRAGDPEYTFGRAGHGHFVGLFHRVDHWNVETTIPKGGYERVKERGIEEFRRTLAALLPEFGEHLQTLRDWRQVSVLTVRADRLVRWHRPGLLTIGDAAHTMSPAVGAGINYAIQDAAVAANVLAGPLLDLQRDGVPVADRHLASVQRRREVPTRFIQAMQGAGHRMVDNIHAGRRVAPNSLRWLVRVPPVRRLLARLFGVGLWRIRVR